MTTAGPPVDLAAPGGRPGQLRPCGTVGEVLQAGQLGALVASIAPPHLRGRYMGVFGLSFGLAAAVGPLLGTQMLEQYGENALWGGAFVLCSAAGVVPMRVSAAADRRAPGAQRVDG